MNWEQLKADQIDLVTSNYNSRFSFDEVEITSQIEFIKDIYKENSASPTGHRARG